MEKRSVALRRPPTRPNLVVVEQQPTTCKDHFISDDKGEYAGAHLILDFAGINSGITSSSNDIRRMERAFRDAVNAAGATLLHIHLHPFTADDGGEAGMSGVAVLAESHISVHTWPERGYAAFDIFMCGSADPRKADAVLRKYFRPMYVVEKIHRRGEGIA